MKKRDFSKPATEPSEQEIIDILMKNEDPVPNENKETEEEHEQADGQDK